MAVNRITFRAACLAVAFAAVLSFGHAGAAEPRAAAASATGPLEFAATDIATVERRDIQRLISLTGTLSPRNQTTVKAKVAAEVREMLVREGEPVRRGQVIARLDATEPQARLDEKIADLEGGRAQLALAEKNRATQLALLEKKFISQNAYDSTLSALQVAEARMKALQAQVAIARKAVEDTVVHAPMNGYVAQRLAQPGEKLAIDGRLYGIVDLAEMEVEAAVPATEIAHVRVGQEVGFRIEGMEERSIAGRIARINPSTQPGTRSILVYALLPNRDGSLRGGMFAKGQLSVNRRSGALVAPLSALREDGSQSYVWQIDQGRLVRTRVQPGLKSEDDGVIEIVSGLAQGAKIVRTNLGSLREGAEARIAERR